MDNFDFFFIGWAVGIASYPCLVVLSKIFENAVKASRG